jgi:hypothetical protein
LTPSSSDFFGSVSGAVGISASENDFFPLNRRTLNFFSHAGLLFRLGGYSAARDKAEQAMKTLLFN